MLSILSFHHLLTPSFSYVCKALVYTLRTQSKTDPCHKTLTHEEYIISPVLCISN